MRNKDAVIRVLLNRGMPPDEAHELVQTIHKANLAANRKHSLYGDISSGLVCALLSMFLISSRRVSGALVVFTMILGFGFLWSSVKFVTASGYEVEDD